MKNLVLLLMFIGILIIIQGYYETKLSQVKSQKTVIKHVPLHIYEGRMNGKEMIDNQFKSTFEKINSL